MVYKNRKKPSTVWRLKIGYIDDCLQREKRKKRKMGKSELRKKLLKELAKDE